MLETVLIEGFIYGIMVLGVFVSYRTLNFCDMTVDGAFPMGGCILAACLLNGVPPSVALLIAFVGGCLAGLCTTMLYTKLRIPDLLAGILMMTMLYSVNLRIMNNRANVSFLRIQTIFSKITAFFTERFPSLPSEVGILLFLIVFIILLKSLLDLFFHTDLGLTMGALGANEQMIVSQGVNPQIVRGIGICFGDGLAALAGAFAAMYNGFADVGSGTGVIVSGLASLMLGEVKHRVADIGVELSFDDSVVELVAKEGFDPVYGARPLRRAIVRMVEDTFSAEMLEGRISKGDKIVAKADGEKVVFEKTAE